MEYRTQNLARVEIGKMEARTLSRPLQELCGYYSKHLTRHGVTQSTTQIEMKMGENIALLDDLD